MTIVSENAIFLQSGLYDIVCHLFLKKASRVQRNRHQHQSNLTLRFILPLTYFMMKHKRRRFSLKKGVENNLRSVSCVFLREIIFCSLSCQVTFYMGVITKAYYISKNKKSFSYRKIYKAINSSSTTSFLIVTHGLKITKEVSFSPNKKG